MVAFGRSAATSLTGRSAGAAAVAVATSSSLAPDNLAQRSLFVHVRPPPASLSERRSVLRVLERYGKTETFKKLGDNGSFIAIASSAAMASTLIQRSPMQYEFLSETFQAAQPWGNPRVATLVEPIETGSSATTAGSQQNPAGAANQTTTNTSSSSSSSSSSSPPDPPQRRQTDHVAHRSFVLSVFPSQDYHHRTTIRNSPLHGPWPRDAPAGNTNNSSSSSLPIADYKETFVYNALKMVVPESASSDALCDWRQHRRGGGGGGGGGGPGDTGSSKSAATHVQERKERRERARKSILSNLLQRSSSGNGGGLGDNKIESEPKTTALQDEPKDKINR